MNTSRIALLSAVLLTIMLNSCSEERPLSAPPVMEPVLHEPWEDGEAEDIACLISGDLCAPRPLYERVQLELLKIREQWRDSIPSVDWIIGQSPSIEPQYWYSMDSAAREDVANGTHYEWDSVINFFNATVSGSYVYVPYRTNLWRVMSVLEDVRGVTSGGWRLVQWDGPRLYAHMEGESIGYLFRDAWGDCPAGCIVSHYHYFLSNGDTIEYVGGWLKSWPRTPEPQWWGSANEAITLWTHGDSQYRFRDATPPGSVTDLRARGKQMGRSIELQFTAPGDLGLDTRPKSHVFRWSRDSVTATNWYSLPSVTVQAAEPGSNVSVTLNSLPEMGRTLIGMRTVDRTGNVSPVSNVVETENILQLGWTIFNEANSELASDEVTALHVDSKARTWVGSDLGVTVLHAGGGEHYDISAHTIFSERVVAIAEDRMGHILVGTRAGAATFDGVSWTTVWPIDAETQDTEVRCILPCDNGDLWLGIGFRGVAQIEDTGWRYHDMSNSGVRGSIVRKVSSSPDGSIWFGADQGLSRLLDDTWLSLGTNTTVTSILVPSPTAVLYGTYDGRLHYIIDGEEWAPFVMKPHETWPRQSASIDDISQSGDRSIWLTTYGSVRRYDPDSLTELLVVLPSISGLPEREITVLAVGTDNTLWIGTKNSGVCRWDLTAAGMPELRTTETANR